MGFLKRSPPREAVCAKSASGRVTAPVVSLLSAPRFRENGSCPAGGSRRQPST